MLVAVALLSMLPSQAEPGISIVSSSTSAEQSYLLSIIGRIEVKANTISLISHEGECLATEPIDVALKLVEPRFQFSCAFPVAAPWVIHSLIPISHIYKMGLNAYSCIEN